ncbi:hypothetical protein K435DRAFT_971493 [Dendrothele bispora CBS 962.96]|uniref:Thioester reductase (TE) domain-containing protein n=1 Tax=Dendrothele bispora (strain CBS 962.96) TaxID=1314807 RepID=A0A4S8L5F3_DENBC|nr:hypothetical protein K435DRAFT_971493 [Dendrothele bispora CBS 962.96]
MCSREQPGQEQSTYVLSVPSMVEAWSRTPVHIDWLISRTAVFYGGGPLDIDAGNHLSKQGVPLQVCCAYGLGFEIYGRPCSYHTLFACFYQFRWYLPSPFPESPVSPKSLPLVATLKANGSLNRLSKMLCPQWDSVIVRLGQTCGSPNGSWNRKEWIPALVRTDLVARAFRDFLDAPDAETQGNPSFVHLIHPRPVRWSTLAQTIGSKLNVDVVPFATWLKKLEEVEKKDKNANQVGEANGRN